MGHIYDSLKELGLVDENSSASGKLEVSETILRALYSLRSHPERNKTTGENDFPYQDVADTLTKLFMQVSDNNKLDWDVK